MSPPAPPPRPRRPLLVPVLIATVFLAVIGATAGAVLGASADRRGPEGSGPVSGDSGVHGSYPSPGDTPTDDDTRCREETQVQGHRAGAVGVLRVERVLRTRSSTVWICFDEDRRLYYHANRRSPDGVWIEGKTALFLPGVEYVDGVYRTRSGSTTFSVSPTALVIDRRDGTKEVQPAVQE